MAGVITRRFARPRFMARAVCRLIRVLRQDGAGADPAAAVQIADGRGVRRGRRRTAGGGIPTRYAVTAIGVIDWRVLVGDQRPWSIHAASFVAASAAADDPAPCKPSL